MRLLVLGLLVATCLSTYNLSAQSSDAMPTRPLQFLALGDSYTIGESVPADQSWPVQLTQRLLDSGVNMASPKIIAQTGWTTDELKAGIKRAELDTTYDLVSLLIGVNNQYRDYPFDQQRKEFDELLTKAITFAGGNPEKVFVVSIPDYGVTPFGKSRDPKKVEQEVNEYNELNREIAQKHHVKYFDITPISRKAIDFPALVAEDGLHPSGEMYAEWVDLIFSWVYKILDE